MSEFCIVFCFFRNRKDCYLVRGKEEWEFSSIIFYDDCNHAFEWSIYCSVDHNWSLLTVFNRFFLPNKVNISVFVFVFLIWCSSESISFVFADMLSHVLQVETDRQLEVQLNSSALVFAVKSIIYFNINFWPLECSISWVQFPFLTVLVQGNF